MARDCTLPKRNLRTVENDWKSVPNRTSDPAASGSQRVSLCITDHLRDDYRLAIQRSFPQAPNHQHLEPTPTFTRLPFHDETNQDIVCEHCIGEDDAQLSLMSAAHAVKTHKLGMPKIQRPKKQTSKSLQHLALANVRNFALQPQRMPLQTQTCSQVIDIS